MDQVSADGPNRIHSVTSPSVANNSCSINLLTEHNGPQIAYLRTSVLAYERTCQCTSLTDPIIMIESLIQQE